MNYRSFLPKIYKLGLVNTLIDRIFKIAHNRTLFYFEMKKVKEFLGKNSYPPHLVETQMRKYIRKSDTPQAQSKTSADTTNICYMKLPYIGKISKSVQDKMVNLCSDLCKRTNIKLVFTSPKITSFFLYKG